jgi:hypothetical protein
MRNIGLPNGTFVANITGAVIRRHGFPFDILQRERQLRQPIESF